MGLFTLDLAGPPSSSTGMAIGFSLVGLARQYQQGHIENGRSQFALLDPCWEFSTALELQAKREETPSPFCSRVLLNAIPHSTPNREANMTLTGFQQPGASSKQAFLSAPPASLVRRRHPDRCEGSDTTHMQYHSFQMLSSLCRATSPSSPPSGQWIGQRGGVFLPGAVILVLSQTSSCNHELMSILPGREP